MQPLILIVGATGFVGARLLARLVNDRRPVRCLARDPRKLADVVEAAARRGAPVEVVKGDVLQPATLPRALAGVGVAFYLVHAMGDGGADFDEREAAQARAFGRAAKEAGVARIVYLGGLGADEIPAGDRAGGTGGAGLSKHLRSRHGTGDALRAGGVPTTEIRAGAVIGAGSASFELLRFAVETLPVVPCPETGDLLTQPIGISDCLDYLQAAAEVPAAAGETIEVGCPAPLSYADMARGYAKVRGLARRVVCVPGLRPGLPGLLPEGILPVPNGVAGPILTSGACETIVKDDRARRIFPAIRPIPYEEALRRAIAREGEAGLDPLTRAAAPGSSASTEPLTVEETEGLTIERRTRVVPATTEALWASVKAFGRTRKLGVPVVDALWWARGLADTLAGGGGETFRAEVPDEAARTLRIAATARLPGRAWLELKVEPGPILGAVLRMTSVFEPRGLAGRLYWRALLPLHTRLFDGMADAIARGALAGA